MGATYESPLACPPQRRRETSLFPQVSGISGLSPPCGRRADAICFGSGGCEGDSAAPGHSSLHSKATGLLHSCEQLLIELLIGLIGRDVNPVKAGKGQRSQSHCWESPSHLHSGWDMASHLWLARAQPCQVLNTHGSAFNAVCLGVFVSSNQLRKISTSTKSKYKLVHLLIVVLSLGVISLH